MKIKNSILLLVSLGIFSASAVSAQSVMQYVRGHILLQVEEHGEAWYVDPVDDRRYYLKDGPAAYVIMRQLSLGITDLDLRKIPVGTDPLVYQRPGFEENIDQDNDGLPSPLEWGLGTNGTVADSNYNGYDDGTEVANGYDPLRSATEPDANAKVEFDYDLVNRLKGRLLLQVEQRGQVWYVNPSDGKRYYLADGPAAYSAMRYLGLGISNADLSKVSGSEMNRFDNGEVEFSYDDMTIATDPNSSVFTYGLDHHGMPESSFLVAGVINSNVQPKKNFKGGYFGVWKAGQDEIDNCKQAMIGGASELLTTEAKINHYVKAVMGTGGGAAAGTSNSYSVYRIAVANNCYQLTTETWRTAVQNYDPSLGISEYNHEAVDRQLRWPLYSFIYNVNQ